MSESTPQSLEDLVVKHFQTLLEKYRQMDAMVIAMLQLQNHGKPIQDELQQLHQHRLDVETFQAQAAPAREAYRKSRTNASDAVKQLSALTTMLIQSIMEKIGSLEEKTKKSYQQLIPEIDKTVRSNQMKTAYGNSMT